MLQGTAILSPNASDLAGVLSVPTNVCIITITSHKHANARLWLAPQSLVFAAHADMRPATWDGRPRGHSDDSGSSSRDAWNNLW